MKKEKEELLKLKRKKIIRLFKINDNSLIERFMLSLSKSHKGFDFDKLRDNFIKIFKNKIELDEHFTIKKFIKELIEKVSFIFQTTTQLIGFPTLSFTLMTAPFI